MSPLLPALLLCAGVCAWLAWRHYALRSELRRLAELLRQEDDPKLDELGIDSAPAELRMLMRHTIDSLAEANLHATSRIAQLKFLEALLNQIEDALIVLDDHLEVRFSNRAAEALFAANAPHPGHSLIEVCLDHRIVDTVALAVEIEGKTQDYIQRKTPLGPGSGDHRRRERTYLVEAEPLPAGASSRGAWLLIRDVTESLQTEQIRRDFIANASHELRTPLSIINGYIEMLDPDEGEVPNTDLLGRAVTTMRAHTDRIVRIVDDMLTVSRLESSESLLKLEDFDLADCISQTIEQLQPIISRQQAKVTLDLPDELRPFHGDPFYWNQIFFNLIENALKQNPDRSLKVKITVTAHGGRLRIAVSDDGVGIPSSDLPLIFKRFYRVDKHHSQARKGTGLGLSIVKRAVEAHDGTISVSSQPGRRTVFEIELPRPGPEVSLGSAVHTEGRKGNPS